MRQLKVVLGLCGKLSCRHPAITEARSFGTRIAKPRSHSWPEIHPRKTKRLDRPVTHPEGSRAMVPAEPQLPAAKATLHDLVRLLRLLLGAQVPSKEIVKGDRHVAVERRMNDFRTPAPQCPNDEKHRDDGCQLYTQRTGHTHSPS